MTHSLYSQTTLEALSTSEVKTIAKYIGAIPDGDKRVKQTWVSAVLDHQVKFSPAKVAATKAHIETVMNRMESVTLDASELPAIDTYVPTPPTHADDVAFAMGLTFEDVFGASMPDVDEDIAHTSAHAPSTNPGRRLGAGSVLIALAAILYAVCIVPIGMGVVVYRSIRWGYSRVPNLSRLSGNPKQTESIDYFPSPA